MELIGNWRPLQQCAGAAVSLVEPLSMSHNWYELAIKLVDLTNGSRINRILNPAVVAWR